MSICREHGNTYRATVCIECVDVKEEELKEVIRDALAFLRFFTEDGNYNHLNAAVNILTDASDESTIE